MWGVEVGLYKGEWMCKGVWGVILVLIVEK